MAPRRIQHLAPGAGKVGHRLGETGPPDQAAHLVVAEVEHRPEHRGHRLAQGVDRRVDGAKDPGTQGRIADHEVGERPRVGRRVGDRLDHAAAGGHAIEDLGGALQDPRTETAGSGSSSQGRSVRSGGLKTGQLGEAPAGGTGARGRLAAVRRTAAAMPPAPARSNRAGPGVASGPAGPDRPADRTDRLVQGRAPRRKRATPAAKTAMTTSSRIHQTAMGLLQQGVTEFPLVSAGTGGLCERRTASAGDRTSGQVRNRQPARGTIDRDQSRIGLEGVWAPPCPARSRTVSSLSRP